MEQWRKQFELWKTKFQASNYSVIRVELQNLKLPGKDKALLADRCLISLNVTSKENLIYNYAVSSKNLVDLYRLATLCCNLVQVAWNSMECNFVTNVFYISKILLHRKYIVEACELCQFVFKYFEELPNAKLDFEGDEINVSSRYIVLFLHATSTFKLSSDEGEKVFHLWNVIFSSSQNEVVRGNFSSVVDYFATFVQNISIEDFIRVEHHLISLTKKLQIEIKSNENAEEILFKFLLTSVSKFCEFSSVKDKSNFFMDILEHSKVTDSVEFCMNIYRICSGILGKDDVSAVIVASSVQLQNLISRSSSVFDAIVYCASTIIVKMSFQNLDEYALNEISIGSLFTIILTLVRRLKDIDTHELFAGKKEGSKIDKYATIAILSIDLMSCCVHIKNINLNNEAIYKSAFEAQKMAISYVDSMDDKSKEQLEHFFWGTYEKWMKTAFVWSLMSPADLDLYMEQFCTAKHDLSCVTSADYTYYELLKMTPKLWKLKNIETVKATHVCALELKAYLKNNSISSKKPITALLKCLKYEDSADVIQQGIFYYAKFIMKLSFFGRENKAEVKSMYFKDQKNSLKLLNTAIDKWTAAIEKCLYSSSPKDDLNELELSYLQAAAFIYRLYCDSNKEINVWKLLYIASKYRGDEEMAVYAVSNLLCTSWKINPRWIKEVEERMLGKVGESLKLRYRLDSYNRGFVEGFTPEQKESLQEITLQTVKEHNLQAKYFYLMARIHFHRILAYTADPYVMCIKAKLELIETFENVKPGEGFAEISEWKSLLLDVIVFTIARCVENFDSGDAPFILLEALEMVQATGLPLRMCQILNLAALRDTHVGYLADCYVKLQCASSILNHYMKPVTKVHYKLTKPFLTSDFRFVINDYDIEFEENPALNSELQFEMPDFASHSENCECDFCVNGEYLRLYCELMSMYGIYFRLLEKWEQAGGFFRGALELLVYAEKRINISDLEAFTLIQYSTYWAARDRFDLAISYNLQVQKMFDGKLRNNFALRNMTLDQYWQMWAVGFFPTKSENEKKLQKCESWNESSIRQ